MSHLGKRKCDDDGDDNENKKQKTMPEFHNKITVEFSDDNTRPDMTFVYMPPPTGCEHGCYVDEKTRTQVLFCFDSPREEEVHNLNWEARHVSMALEKEEEDGRISNVNDNNELTIELYEGHLHGDDGCTDFASLVNVGNPKQLMNGTIEIEYSYYDENLNSSTQDGGLDKPTIRLCLPAILKNGPEYFKEACQRLATDLDIPYSILLE